MALGVAVESDHQGGHMTAEEYRDLIAALGLSQVAAAILLGVDERTSRRWASGEREIPPPVARFLRYLLATGTTGETAIKVLDGH
jgi:DNA-binding transcriptional regulator YiaG